ncbi:protein crumbs-like isoform X2 [Patiria miniata]|uniref:Uncharacterized protein n=1 Tax=Patiria miniata TaxID=46514 RepID=A0A913ZMR5_PATMI|nr:protein crumbs-like isoform X2 [Patiria miniata]
MKGHTKILKVSFVLAMMCLLSVRGNPVEKGVSGLVGKKKQDPRSGDIDLSKPGTCPTEPVVSMFSPSVCALDCLFDLECPGTERCCPDHCGGTACIETTENADESTTTRPVTEPVTTPAADTGDNTEVIRPQTTVSTAKTTEATTSPKTTGNPDLYLQGDVVVNVSAVVGQDLVLHCKVSTSADEPLLLFWMVQIGVGYLPWSDVPPTDNKRVSHGGSRLEINGATLEDSQRFVCFGGHSKGYLTQTYVVTVTEKPGTDQESPADGCGNHACMNGGTCVEEDQSFRCVCPDGFKGENCTEPSDPCQRHPNVCQNGATCVPDDGDAVLCACAEGWEGRHCEKRASPCVSNPCHNGGSCEDLEGEYQCICSSEFTGPRCEEEVVVTTKPNGEEMSDACYLPLDKGNCSRKETKWYYDTETQLCRQFIYNGCQGNANRFRSYDECQWECPELPRDPCSHPIATGRCKASIPRWAYSTESKKCVEFVYGGCGPTGNNFLTEEECAQTCMSDTQQPCERCGTPSLAEAYCDSDFVITGIVRRQLISDGRLKTVVLELTRSYKGHGLTLRRSRFLDEPLVIAKSRSHESNGCSGRCFEDLEDGKEYILTGTLSGEGASKSVAFLTSSSYIKPAVSRRLVKLELIRNDRAFNRRCSRRLQTPL